eukprot:scaffold495_cov243-Pinguiococcus_pyrenoidosus.AAC.42
MLSSTPAMAWCSMRSRRRTPCSKARVGGEPPAGGPEALHLTSRSALPCCAAGPGAPAVRPSAASSALGCVARACGSSRGCGNGASGQIAAL